MFPILFRIGPITLHTYGLFVALGFFAAVKIASFFAVREGGAKKSVEDSFYQLIVILIFSGIVGARLFYVLSTWDEFRDHLIDVIKVWQGGLVFYGGFLGAVAGFIFWYRKNRAYPWLQIADWIAPAAAFGHALGRLGCFSAGCCYGKPTDKPWGVIFSHPESLAPLGISLHPTQLYEFFFLIALGTFLFWRAIQRKSEYGFVFADYLLIYPVGRFVIEIFRGDLPRTAGLTPGQWTSILIFLAGIVFRIVLAKKSTSENS